MATLPVELPVSTTIMLRSIAAIARNEGEDPSDPEAEEAQELARRARAIKIPRRGRRRLEVEYEFDMDRRFNGFEFVDADNPPSGVLDCHTSICGGRFAANMTSERAVSCFGISGDAILASTND